MQLAGASPGCGCRAAPKLAAAGRNYGVVREDDGHHGQSCSIIQPSASGTNQAVVWMVTPKLTGLTQSSAYSASITQGPTSAAGSSNNNLACVTQSVRLDGSTTKTNAASTTVTNDNHESITIKQNSLTGNNTRPGRKADGRERYDCDASGRS